MKPRTAWCADHPRNVKLNVDNARRGNHKSTTPHWRTDCVLRTLSRRWSAGSEPGRPRSAEKAHISERALTHYAQTYTKHLEQQISQATGHQRQRPAIRAAHTHTHNGTTLKPQKRAPRPGTTHKKRNRPRRRLTKAHTTRRRHGRHARRHMGSPMGAGACAGGCAGGVSEKIPTR